MHCAKNPKIRFESKPLFACGVSQLKPRSASSHDTRTTCLATIAKAHINIQRSIHVHIGKDAKHHSNGIILSTGLSVDVVKPVICAKLSRLS